MFLGDGAVALGLIALIGGVSLLIWSLRNDGKGVGIAKTFGYIVIIISIFATLCTSYYITSYWAKGYFHTPAGMSIMQKKSMMDGQMHQ